MASSATYSFNLASNTRYSYFIDMEGYAKYCSSFTMNDRYKENGITITADQIRATDANYINRELGAVGNGTAAGFDEELGEQGWVGIHSGKNVADIYLSINAQGYLNLNQGATYQIRHNRSWQIVENTVSQHFIVLTGLNAEGKIMVNDPYAPNYEKWDLQRAFVEGFDEGDILYGYSGAWIYDKSAMPEEPFIYSEPEPERGDPRYPDIQLTLEEKQLLACVVWVEARGESLEGQQAVAEVVLNRMAAEGFSDSLKGVIYAEGQFRSVPYLDDAEPYQAQYDAIEKAIYGPYVLSEDVVYFATYPVNDHVWGQIGGHIFCYG